MTLISITSSTTNIRILLNPIQDGPFRDFSPMGEGAKRIPLLKNLPHISYNDETGNTYTLPKEKPKK